MLRHRRAADPEPSARRGAGRAGGDQAEHLGLARGEAEGPQARDVDGDAALRVLGGGLAAEQLVRRRRR